MNWGTLFGKEAKAGDRLPYVRHVDPTTLLTRDGMLLQTIQLDGYGFETADTEELNHRLAVRETMLRSIGSGRIALYHHIVRRRVQAGLQNRFDDPVCMQIDQQWQDRLSSRALFVNDLFLTLVYKPTDGHVGWLEKVRERLTKRTETRSDSAHWANELRALDSVRETVLASLEKYEPRVLTEYETQAGVCSEPIELLSLLYNAELRPVLKPEGDIGHYIPYRRLSFGLDAAEQSGGQTDPFSAILSIKDYPSTTTPGMLDGLLRLPTELVISESFRFAPRQTAQERIELALRRLRAADDDTVTLRRGLMQAKDDVAAGNSGFGEHHLTVLVRAEDLPQLDRHTAMAQAALADTGAIAVREDLNLEAAFWAQFPGNLDYIARRALISTSNFAGLCSLHGFPTGSPTDNHWGDAVTVFETTSASPYYFNFHHGDLGNFLVVGPSGTGKTVVLNFLAAQAQKFNPRTVYFDKDRGAEIFVRAIGGRYDVLRKGEPSGLNPLQLEDSPAARAFVRDWLACLLSRPDAPVGTAEKAIISEAVDANFEQPRQLRRLCYLRELLGGSQRAEADDLSARIAPWCGNGEYAWLFDSPEDRVSLSSRVIGFDMTDLLDHPELRTPAMMYLFHRVEQRLDGTPTLIVVDEGWKALDDIVFKDRLKDWLKTIRKRNGIVGFCTQSAGDALESSIAPAIIEQSATQILMPNPRAAAADYCGGLGLTQQEFEIVRSIPEHARCFLVRQSGQSVVARLNLSEMPHVLTILSGREETVRQLDRLRAQFGDAPTNWLKPLLGIKTERDKSQESKSTLERQRTVA